MFHKIISDGDQIKKVLLFPGEDMMREQCRAEQQHRESKYTQAARLGQKLNPSQCFRFFCGGKR